MRMASLRDRTGYGVDGGDRKMEEALQNAAAGRKTLSVSSRRGIKGPMHMV
jgi:hypothetical protein